MDGASSVINTGGVGRVRQTMTDQRRRANENDALFGPLSKFHMLAVNSSLHDELKIPDRILVSRLSYFDHKISVISEAVRPRITSEFRL